MKTLKHSLLALVAIAASLQLYLSIHYYQLHSPEGASSSICNINKVFNCDAVSISSFSSIAGIPISNLGFSLHLLLLGLLILNILSPSNSKKRLQVALSLSSFSLLGSIIMAGISLLFLNVYCIFCIALYVLSILIWLALKKLIPESKLNIKTFFNIQLLTKPMLSILVLSFLSHILLAGPTNTKESNKQIAFIIEEWESNPYITITQRPMLTLGASKDKAKVTIIEFADYLCPHCKYADSPIKAFVLAHSSDTRLEFYPFPLDSQCNSALKFSRGGLTCKLTQAVFCATKQQQGWKLHHLVFKNQKKLQTSYNQNDFFSEIQNNISDLNFKKWKNCFSNPTINEQIVNFSQAGKDAEIQGTPSFLVNNRKLKKAQFLPVLKAARTAILNK